MVRWRVVAVPHPTDSRLFLGPLPQRHNLGPDILAG
jgi:hypothetical protein